MMRNRYTLFFFWSVMLCFQVEGQHPEEASIQSYLKLGIGSYPDYLGNTDNLSTQVPHFFLYYEVEEGDLFNGQLRKGLLLGYASYDWHVANDPATRIASVSFLNIGARLSYYFDLGTLKPYIGSEIFYTHASTKFEADFAEDNMELEDTFNLSSVLGVAYPMASGTEVFAEGGIGFMSVRFGITITDFLK